MSAIRLVRSFFFENRFSPAGRISPASMVSARSLCLFAAALLLIAVATAFATDWTCPYCHQTFHFDPRDGAYMGSWIQLHLTQVHGIGTGGSAASPPSGANPFDALFQPIGQALARALFGNPQQKAIEEAQARQRREQLAAGARLEEERQAHEAQLAAEERQRQFAEDKARILSQMKGFDGRSYDGASTQTGELRVREINDDIFRTKAVKPEGGEVVDVLQLKSIDFKSNVPPVGPEVETPESKAEHERMQKEILAYQALIDRGRKQLDQFHEAEGVVEHAEAQLAAARKDEAEARQAKDALEAPPPGVLDDASAALAKAEQASAEADRALAEARNQRSGIEKQMRETLQTLAQTPRPPDWIDQAPVVPPDR